MVSDHQITSLKNGSVTGSILGELQPAVTLAHVHVGGHIGASAAARSAGSIGLTVTHSVVDGGIQTPVCFDMTLTHNTLGGVAFVDFNCGVELSITHNVIVGSGIHGSAGFDFPDVDGTIANNLIVGSTGAGISLVNEPGYVTVAITKNVIVGSAGDGITITGFFRRSGAGSRPR